MSSPSDYDEFDQNEAMPVGGIRPLRPGSLAAGLAALVNWADDPEGGDE